MEKQDDDHCKHKGLIARLQYTALVQSGEVAGKSFQDLRGQGLVVQSLVKGLSALGVLKFQNPRVLHKKDNFFLSRKLTSVQLHAGRSLYDK